MMLRFTTPRTGLLTLMLLTGFGLACGGNNLEPVGGSGGAGGSGASAGSGGAGSGGDAGSGGSAGSSGSGPERFWNDLEVGDPPLCPTEGRPDKSQRPQVDDAADIEPVYLAMNRLRIGAANPTLEFDPNVWMDIGFNLDRSCNSATWPAEVLTGEALSICQDAKFKACKNSLQDVFDGNACRDNAFGTLFGIVGASPVLGEPYRLNELDWNCALHRGEMGIGFKISGYNGLRDDPQVRVDLYSLLGVTEPPAWRCRSGAGAQDQLNRDWLNNPAVSASSPWQVAERDIAPGAPNVAQGQISASKWADASAFVRNGWLVAEFPPGTELWFHGAQSHVPGMRLLTHNSVLAAKLVQDSQTGQWGMPDATLGGSMKPQDMVNSFREMGFCENGCDSYTTTVGYLTQTTDMLSASNDAMPDSPCDAMSFGMQFSAAAMTPGPRVATAPPPDVSGGRCGTPPANEDIDLPGCTCSATGGRCL